MPKKKACLPSEKQGSISDNKQTVNTSYPIDRSIVAVLRSNGRGWVFTPRDFLALGTRGAVDKALSRHAARGTIRRLARGLYHFPKTHPVLGELVPNADVIGRALAGKDAVRLQPSGAYAANLLGLSEQVPAKLVFLTDGASKKVKVGQREFVLKQTTPRNMATAGRISGMVIQALRHLGQRRISDEMIETLKRKLSPNDKQQIVKDLIYAPAWIGEIMRKITEAGKS